MRRALIMAFLLVTVAGCAASPQSLGLTGAQPVPPPPLPNDATLQPPGIAVDTGTNYGPSMVPTTGAGRYYGY